jgi:flagellar biosynthetic protein FliR
VPAGLTLSLSTLYAFLLVLARVGGALAFVPLPGIRGGPEPARAAFALGFTLALAARWPAIDGGAVTPARLIAWVAAEAALGIAIGVIVAIVLEAFSVAAQVLGLQAGYGYASTVDPTTQADSGVLVVLAQLMSGMLFFALGMDRQVLRLFAESLGRVPAGAYVPGRPAAQAVIELGSMLFSVGVRLALPVVVLLVLVDVALALLGRLNQHLQLLSLAFPLKMLAALVMLSVLAALFPRIMLELAGHAWPAARRVLGS